MWVRLAITEVVFGCTLLVSVSDMHKLGGLAPILYRVVSSRGTLPGACAPRTPLGGGFGVGQRWVGFLLV